MRKNKQPRILLVSMIINFFSPTFILKVEIPADGATHWSDRRLSRLWNAD